MHSLLETRTRTRAWNFSTNEGLKEKIGPQKKLVPKLIWFIKIFDQRIFQLKQERVTLQERIVQLALAILAFFGPNLQIYITGKT